MKKQVTISPERISAAMAWLGSRKSTAKSEAAKRNGKLGGRPKKIK